MTKTRGAGAAPMRQRAGGGGGQNKLRMLFPSLYLTFKKNKKNTNHIVHDTGYSLFELIHNC